MKKDKPKLTKEELSRIRSEAGKKGAKSTRERGHFKGGRPKGSPNKNPLIGLPSKSLTVREPDYQVFVKCAFAANVPLVEFMHLNAEGLKKRNPQIFGTDAPTVEA